MRKDMKKRHLENDPENDPRKVSKRIRLSPLRVNLEPPLLQTSSLFNRETHATTTSIAGKRIPSSADPYKASSV